MLVKDETLIEAAKTLSEIYTEYKDEDGFLYITFTREDTFG